MDAMTPVKTKKGNLGDLDLCGVLMGTFPPTIACVFKSYMYIYIFIYLSTLFVFVCTTGFPNSWCESIIRVTYVGNTYVGNAIKYQQTICFTKGRKTEVKNTTGDKPILDIMWGLQVKRIVVAMKPTCTPTCLGVRF